MSIRTYKEYEYEKARRDAQATGEPLWDTLQSPDRYVVGWLIAELEEAVADEGWEEIVVPQPLREDPAEIFRTQARISPIPQKGILWGYPESIAGWRAKIKVTPNRLLVSLLPEEYRTEFWEISDVFQDKEDALSQAHRRLEARIAPIRERVKESLTGYTYAYAAHPDAYADLVTPMEKSGVEFVITQFHNEQIIEILAKKGEYFEFFTGIDLYPEPIREQYGEIDKCRYPVV